MATIAWTLNSADSSSPLTRPRLFGNSRVTNTNWCQAKLLTCEASDFTPLAKLLTSRHAE